ncbi:MAG TPA: winged helix-turn-helix domain-containing protein [Nitrososphaerales archaeon]|nr:winged helix-turn-helix domain-containing protein [Nitrososphaerales archaeon]
MSGIQGEGEAPTQRRSKTEMVCDLMLAVAGGAVRPTKIMQKANLTWNALLVYLQALALNGLIRRVEKGNVATYHLTEKGEEVLQAYLKLKDKLGPLKLETVDTRTTVEALKIPAAQPKAPDNEVFAEGLRRDGFQTLEPVVKGRSGVQHQFGVVAKDPSGVTHGYVFASEPDEALVISLFVAQLDTGFKLHVVHREEPTPSAMDRAKEYGIEFTKSKPDLRSRGISDVG